MESIYYFYYFSLVLGNWNHFRFGLFFSFTSSAKCFSCTIFVDWLGTHVDINISFSFSCERQIACIERWSLRFTFCGGFQTKFIRVQPRWAFAVHRTNHFHCNATCCTWSRTEVDNRNDNKPLLSPSTPIYDNSLFRFFHSFSVKTQVDGNNNNIKMINRFICFSHTFHVWH